ncbi:hypothetical protein Tco_0278686 [Tanacetum coccineum]
MDTGSTSTDNLIESLTNTLALLNQSFKAHLPQTNNQLQTSSNARNNATVQDDIVVFSRCFESCRSKDYRRHLDTRDMAEITRKRMMEKMQSPQCVENKVRIAPPDYSKENLLATFAPQRNLTPEQ